VTLHVNMTMQDTRRYPKALSGQVYNVYPYFLFGKLIFSVVVSQKK